MRDRLEHILLTSLAAYGLVTLLEGFLCPPRPRVIVLDHETAQELRAVLDEEDGE